MDNGDTLNFEEVDRCLIFRWTMCFYGLCIAERSTRSLCSVGSPEFVQKQESIFIASRRVVCECLQCTTYEPDLRLPASMPEHNHLSTQTILGSRPAIDGGCLIHVSVSHTYLFQSQEEDAWALLHNTHGRRLTLEGQVGEAASFRSRRWPQ